MMLIPRFMFNGSATLKGKQGYNGRGELITTTSWTKPCYFTTKSVKSQKDGVYTKETQYTITLEKADIKVGDILVIGNVNIEVKEVPPDQDQRSLYMEVTGYVKV